MLYGLMSLKCTHKDLEFNMLGNMMMKLGKILDFQINKNNTTEAKK